MPIFYLCMSISRLETEMTRQNKLHTVIYDTLDRLLSDFYIEIVVEILNTYFVISSKFMSNIIHSTRNSFIEKSNFHA